MQSESVKNVSLGGLVGFGRQADSAKPGGASEGGAFTAEVRKLMAADAAVELGSPVKAAVIGWNAGVESAGAAGGSAAAENGAAKPAQDAYSDAVNLEELFRLAKLAASAESGGGADAEDSMPEEIAALPQEDKLRMGSELISHALKQIAAILGLPDDGDAPAVFEFEPANIEQFAAIMAYLDLTIKMANDRIDVSANAESANMAMAAYGMESPIAHIEPEENAAELSEFAAALRTEKFRMDMAFRLIGVSGMIAEKITEKSEAGAATGIPQAVNPADLSMPVADTVSAFSNLIREELSASADRVRQIARGQAEMTGLERAAIELGTVKSEILKAALNRANSADGAPPSVKNGADADTGVDNKANVKAGADTGLNAGVNAASVKANANIEAKVDNKAGVNIGVNADAKGNVNTAGAKADVNINVNTGVNTGVNTYIKPDANTGVNTTVTAEAKAGVNTYIKPEANAGVNATVSAEAKPAVNAGVNTAAKPAVNADADADAGVNASAKPAVNTGIDTAAKPGVNADADAGFNASAKPAVNTGIDTAAKPGVNADADTGVNAAIAAEAKPDVDASVNKSVNAAVNTAVNADVDADVNTTDVNTAANNEAKPGAAPAAAKADAKADADANAKANVKAGVGAAVSAASASDANAEAKASGGRAQKRAAAELPISAHGSASREKRSSVESANRLASMSAERAAMGAKPSSSGDSAALPLSVMALAHGRKAAKPADGEAKKGDAEPPVQAQAKNVTADGETAELPVSVMESSDKKQAVKKARADGAKAAAKAVAGAVGAAVEAAAAKTEAAANKAADEAFVAKLKQTAEAGALLKKSGKSTGEPLAKAAASDKGASLSSAASSSSSNNIGADADIDAGRSLDDGGDAEASGTGAVNGSGSRTAAAKHADKADAPAATQDDRFEVIRQLSEKMNNAVRAGANEVRMVLRPEALGEVRMSLRVQGDVVFARMQVENKQVKAIVESNLQSLKDSLNRQNLEFGAIDVEVGAGSDGGKSPRELWQEMEDRAEARGFRQAVGVGVDGAPVGGGADDGFVSTLGSDTGRRFGDNTFEYFA